MSFFYSFAGRKTIGSDANGVWSLSLIVTTPLNVILPGFWKGSPDSDYVAFICSAGALIIFAGH
jgi:hypothetical protein